MDAMVAAPASQTMSIANMVRAQYDANKVSLPLSGGLSYVGFEHVQGVPSNGPEGYSIYRLKLLDLMIERLSGAATENAAGASAGSLARQELSSVTAALRSDDGSLADSLVSERNGSTRAFLMNLVA